jgi:3-oxoacyl-[acyl-carrier protein] reductase
VELKNRVAIVTGSADNIGRATASRLASHGASLVVHARRNRSGVDETVGLIEAAGGRAASCLADLTTEEGAEALAATAIDAFGRLDILVNNAALRRNTPVERLSLAEWHEVLHTNLDTAFLASRTAIPHMRRGGWGRIVSLGGMTAHRGGMGRTHVAASKMGIVGLTKALATELAADGITVNCVVPGMVDTKRGTAAGARPDHPLGHDNLLGREGDVEELAHMITMLCLPGAGYTTGQTIHVNGGGYLP